MFVIRPSSVYYGTRPHGKRETTEDIKANLGQWRGVSFARTSRPNLFMNEGMIGFVAQC